MDMAFMVLDYWSSTSNIKPNLIGSDSGGQSLLLNNAILTNYVLCCPELL